MNNDQLKAAFDAMHADDELADRALSRASRGKKPRRRDAVVRAHEAGGPALLAFPAS